MEKFSSSINGVASGTNKTLINLFHSAATPFCRGEIAHLLCGSVATPADQAFELLMGRTTAVGTEGAGYVPNNLDPAGPAGEMDSGNAHSAEPTYTSVKEMLRIPINQRLSWQWWATPGYEPKMTATQNNGMGVKSASSTSTQAHSLTILHHE